MWSREEQKKKEITPSKKRKAKGEEKKRTERERAREPWTEKNKLSHISLSSPVLLSFSTFSRAMTAPVASTSTTSLGESLQRACPAAALSSSSSSSSSSLQQQQLARHRRHRRRSFSFFMLPALLLLLLFCIASPTLVLSRSGGAPCELWPGEKLPPVYARCGNER